MFAEAIEAILRDHCAPAAVRAIEGGASPRALWAALADAGFLKLLASESAGGAELPLPQLYPVLLQFGRHALPVPAAQAIAARALLPAGAVPEGPLTLAPALQRHADGSLLCPLVPFGSGADHVLAGDGSQLVLLDAADAQRSASGIHGSDLATLAWTPGTAARPVSDDTGALEAFGAAIYAALLAGALQRVFEMTLQYCNDRVQFGRSLGKFQAVQHQLAEMAEHVAAAGLAAEAAFQGDGGTPVLLAAAIAKSRASEAAVLVANHAHALHGAIGVTEECDLQLFTRRLHAWRMAHGAEAHWNRRIGEQLLQSQVPLAQFVRLA